MSLKWSNSEQKDVITIIGILWAGMAVGYTTLPADTTFELFKFPLALRSVFTLMLIFWGVALFWLFVSRLPLSKKTKTGCLAQALLWLVVMPGVFVGLLFVLVALVYTYPILSPLLAPGFVLGTAGFFFWYLRMVGISSMTRLAKWTARHVPKLSHTNS
jgi:hypothetical protein